METKKIYKVFVISTYEDLKKEREIVLDILLKRNCMPVGMELFPALHKEQFEYIKEKIDESDYYVVLIGGMYALLIKMGLVIRKKNMIMQWKVGKKSLH